MSRIAYDKYSVSAMVRAETRPRVSASDSVSALHIYSVSAKISFGRSLLTTFSLRVGSGRV